jgi:hypothetical protein
MLDRGAARQGAALSFSCVLLSSMMLSLYEAEGAAS